MLRSDAHNRWAHCSPPEHTGDTRNRARQRLQHNGPCSTRQRVLSGKAPVFAAASTEPRMFSHSTPTEAQRRLRSRPDFPAVIAPHMPQSPHLRTGWLCSAAPGSVQQQWPSEGPDDVQIAHSQLGYPHRPGAHGTTQLGSHAWRLGSRHRSRSRQLLHAAQMTSGSTHVAHGSCTESKIECHCSAPCLIPAVWWQRRQACMTAHTPASQTGCIRG